MRHHIGKKRTKSGKFLLIFTRHTVKKRLFAVHHFIMRNRQDKGLRKGIHHRKSQFIVLVFAEERIGGKIIERVVHPTHIPLGS